MNPENLDMMKRGVVHTGCSMIIHHLDAMKAYQKREGRAALITAGLKLYSNTAFSSFTLHQPCVPLMDQELSRAAGQLHTYHCLSYCLLHTEANSNTPSSLTCCSVPKFDGSSITYIEVLVHRLLHTEADSNTPSSLTCCSVPNFDGSITYIEVTVSAHPAGCKHTQEFNTRQLFCYLGLPKSISS